MTLPNPTKWVAETRSPVHFEPTVERMQLPRSSEPTHGQR
jgi:hypothetical protein